MALCLVVLSLVSVAQSKSEQSEKDTLGAGNQVEVKTDKFSNVTTVNRDQHGGAQMFSKCTGHPKAHGCSAAAENAHESARAIDGLVPYSVATPRQKSVPIVFLLAESTGPRREYGGR